MEAAGVESAPEREPTLGVRLGHPGASAAGLVQRNRGCGNWCSGLVENLTAHAAELVQKHGPCSGVEPRRNVTRRRNRYVISIKEMGSTEVERPV